MDLIRLLVHADLRRRWRSWLAVVVLAAVVTGVAMASVAGWRRTGTAMDRFIDFNRPPNAFVEGKFTRDDIEAIEGVEAVIGGDYFLLVPLGPDGEPRPQDLGTVSPFSFDDPKAFGQVGRPIVIGGRLADPAVASEVMVDEEMADRYDLAAGDRLRMQGYGFDQLDALFEGLGSLMPTGEVLDLTVTGIVRSPEDVVPPPKAQDVVYLGSAAVLLGPAFHEQHWGEDIPSLGLLFGDVGGPGNTSFELRVDFAQVSRDELRAAVRALDPEEGFVDFAGNDSLRARDEAQRSIRLQASMLLALGVLVAVGGAVLLAQALRRQLEADRTTQRSLGALGAPRATAVGVAAAKAGLLAAALVPLAVLVAVVLSPLSPVGHARRAEVDPGLAVDVLVLLAGSAAAVLVLAGFLLITAWREAGSSVRGRVGRRAGVGASERAAQLGLSPAVVAGVRAASLGTGRWTAVATVFAAAVGIVGTLGFASSEGRLASDPDLWGWTFDATVGDGNDPSVGDRAEETLAGNPLVDAYALRYEIEGVTVRAGDAERQVDATVIEDVEGSIEPRLLAGALPRSDDEVALGGATARQLGVGVGDEVRIAGPGDPLQLTVSGLVVMHLGLNADRIGEGVVLAPAALPLVSGGDEDLGPAFALVRYAPDADPDEAYAGLREDWSNTVLEPIRTLDVDQLHDVRHLPVWFSGLLAVVAVATLAFVLVVTVRRRRHDLALLRTLGFERRDVRTTVLAQAITLVLPAALVGAVLGVAAGRVAWSLTAESLGAPEVHATPIAAVLGVVLGAIGVAWLVSVLPGRTASRLPPASILRTE